MERNLFKYILKHSMRDQVLILIVVAVSLGFYYVSLDLPKTIVNAIQHLTGHPERMTTFMHLEFGLPGFLGGGRWLLFDGFHLGREAYLIAICLLFLVFVVINNWFKIYINTAKGRMGERMLRRMRYELFDKVLRFPQAQFRKVKQAEISTMIKDEVEPLGGFIGDAFVQPAFLGGQALIERWVLALDLSPVQFMILSQAIIFVLGWPLEWTEIIVIFVPIFLPLLKHFNIDPVLWGTLVFVNLQAAFLSPPVAMSAFYLKGVAPKHVTLNQIFSGMMPYMIIVIICMVIMYFWPGMTLWLPNYLYGN